MGANASGARTATEATSARALSDMQGCAIVLGSHGKIVYANDNAKGIMSIGPYVGRSFGDYFSENSNADNDAFYEVFLDSVRRKGERSQGRCPFTAPDGKRYWFFVTSSLLSYDDKSYLVITCADVTAEEEEQHLRRESAYVFLAAIVYLCLYVFAYSVWNYLGKPFEPPYMTRIVELGGVILGYLVFKHTSLTLDNLGLSTKNLRHNLFVDGIACLVIIAVFCVLKLVLMRVAPGIISHPEAFYDPSWYPVPRILMYAVTAVLQEFLSRGIMQESLLHVIPGKNRVPTAIIMSTLMFAALHLHYTPFFMAGAAVMLGVFGIIYNKQRSIWGLALIHFTFGCTAFVLGLAG